jgi:hypothetical protein
LFLARFGIDFLVDKIGDRLHHVCGLNEFGQKKFATPKQITDGFDARYKGFVHQFQRITAFFKMAFRDLDGPVLVGFDEYLFCLFGNRFIDHDRFLLFVIAYRLKGSPTPTYNPSRRHISTMALEARETASTGG